MSAYEEEIPIVPWPEDAPEVFGCLCEIINETLPFAARIEHIGSTSVPGLAGKGIIDALVICGEGQAEEAALLLRQAGFDHNAEIQHAEDRWYASGDVDFHGEPRHVHIHITFTGSAAERDHLGFPAYLRSHPEEAARYESLKRHWREASCGDRVVFTEMKTPYVREILERAHAEKMGGGVNGYSAVEIIGMIDHAVLKSDCTRVDILAACELAKNYRLGSLVVPPMWAEVAAAQLRDCATPLGSVVGFPFGYNLPGTKATEAAALMQAGCDELDMVMNVSALRSGQLDLVQMDIEAVAKAMGAQQGGPVLKVILETCYLNDDEIAAGVKAAVDGGAQYVKTSTGFATHGAKVEHVALMRKCAPVHIGVKAAGGIRTLADVKAMLAAGANRIGCSATQAIIGELGL